MKFTTIAAAIVASAVISGPVFAAQDKPNGAHYNLNIIGVEKDKKSKMTGSNRHVIFVPLKSTKSGKLSTNNATAIVDSKIWLVPGDDFRVCDGNAFDLAYGCDDTYLGDWSGAVSDIDLNGDGSPDEFDVPIVSTRNGAVFQLPCNTNLNGETYIDSESGEELPLDRLISCNEAIAEDGTVITYIEGDQPWVPTANYQVWARALGKPGGSATVTTCATLDGELQCSLENTVQTRDKGKSPWADVTNELTSLVVDYCIEYEGDICITWGTERIALFAGDTQDWFWNYDNNGLRLAQLRFYEIPVAP